MTAVQSLTDICIDIINIGKANSLNISGFTYVQVATRIKFYSV